jgi:hypothetical protein
VKEINCYKDFLHFSSQTNVMHVLLTVFLAVSDLVSQQKKETKRR